MRANPDLKGAAVMTEMCASLLGQLRAAVGRTHVITDPAAARAYTEGYRIGGGAALAIVRPATLVELWWCARACVAADCIIIVQAANTGLTGGSTPAGEYDRPVVLINTLRIGGIIPILAGRQAISLAGATLADLEDRLAPFGRVPHSVLGSSCLGASVVGGICNNSGGALVSRGPAFTRRALYARVDEDGRLLLVNNLGIDLAHDPEQALAILDGGTISPERITQGDGPAAGADYEEQVRGIDQPTPARHNADSRCHFEASGSAGKVIVFAVRTESFPAPRRKASFLLATNDAMDLAAFRRLVLRSFRNLPISAEYLHGDAARLAASHGRDLCLAVRRLGPRRIPMLFAAKRRIDRLFGRAGSTPSERLLQTLSRLAPHPLPATTRHIAESHEHLLLLTVADEGIEEARDHIRTGAGPSLTIHACTPSEAAALQRLRFATAGAMVRMAAVKEGAGPLVAIDCALPRNRADWRITLSPHLADQLLLRADYGHFLCHVFHIDFILRPGCDATQFEHALVPMLRKEGVMCPAEHNFGHHYHAPDNVVSFYRSLDPTNSLNPGIGQTSRAKHWA